MTPDPTPEQIVKTITSHDELNGFEQGLRTSGRLTDAAIKAIKQRRDELAQRGMK